VRRGGKISHFLCALVDEKALPPLSGGGTAGDAGSAAAPVEQGSSVGANTLNLGDTTSGRSNGSQDVSSAGSFRSSTLAGKRYVVVGTDSEGMVSRCNAHEGYILHPERTAAVRILAFTKVGGGFKDEDLHSLQYENEC